MFIAVSYDNEPVVIFLLNQKAKVNIANKSGFTPLIVAAIRGNFDIVKDLVTFNADVNIKDRFGKTALTYATLEQVNGKENEYQQIRELLKSKGAN